MSFWGLFDGIASTDALTESRVLEAGADATAAGLEPKHPHAMSEEEYRASEWYDKRIPYAPNMTPARARVMKEQRDRRDKEEAALAHDNQGAWRGALSLAAGLFASLPDPINLVPFGMGIKAVTLGRTVGKAALAGAVGNVTEDALVVFPWANAYGEDLGFSELVKDAVFGAALGAGLGAAGYGLAKWLAKSRALPGTPGTSGESGGRTPADFDSGPDNFFDSFDTSLAGTVGERGAPDSRITERSALRHENVATMDDVYSLAEQTQERFYSDVETWATESGGEAIFRADEATGLRTLKSRERAARKLAPEEYDGDASRVVDVLGGTIMYDTRARVEAAAARIKQGIEESGGVVLRDNNRFEKPVSGGYKDYHLNYRYPNGFTVELQLNTRAMVEAKNGIGHALYEAMDKAEKILRDPDGTPEDKVDAKRVLRWLKEASEKFYASTGDQSSATASASEIVSPYVNIEAYGELSAGTRVYRELGPELALIRNKLPSSEYTYGKPSQSIKESTNTGALGPDVSQGPNLEASRPSIKRTMSGMEEPPSDTSNISRVPEDVKTSERVSGEETQVLSGDIEDAAHYEVRELAEVIPSHDPANGFTRRADYPAIAQERPYHSDRGEQDKVRRNALEFKWRYLVNDLPSASDGPPIITGDGIVLGGNSRAMSLALVYEGNPEKAAQYRQALVNEAAVYGIDGAAVQGMKQPVL